jgi:hypothetical protein
MRSNAAAANRQRDVDFRFRPSLRSQLFGLAWLDRVILPAYTAYEDETECYET